MSWQRIWAMILRYLYGTRDSMRIIEFLFWPTMDIAYFGLIARWSGNLANDTHLIQNFVTALVLWQIIYRANFEICVNMMDEFLESNLINIVGSPLRKGEWIIAMMANGLIKLIFTLFFGVFIGWLFFNVNVLSLGLPLVFFAACCLVSGWIIGLIGASIFIYKGVKLQQLPWVIIMLSSLLSAVFYPIEVLPPWMKWISQCLPMSYIFQGLRDLLITGHLSVYHAILNAVLSAFYLTLAIKFFLFMFERSRNRGFNRLT